ncbi:endonuclease/exonuclease/phosphatase [Salinivibrio siamensis]|uniref:Endonuclease/exonuclease/phosphatase n=1 Tax=Salinivibrio siamensis TaxID=414286 RepID=A0ABX3K7W1_9GAMM|nr:endonuclease/exonuclease/phosphatase [Salinivibrio siamensis]
MAEIERYLDGTPYKALSLDHSVGNTRYDTAVIYNSLTVAVSHLEDLKRFPRNQTIKVGQVLQVVDRKDGDKFKIILCHWSSRIDTSGEPKRHMAAQGLYDATSDMMRKSDHIIIMGDFNARPYDKEMLEGLKATRCHESVRKYPTELFYNPFWRDLSPKEIYNYTMKDKKHFPSGSHRYKDRYGDYWHTFDQIIFSGNFIGNGEWHLNESTTGALSSEYLISSILDSKSIIDHLPVVCEIVKHP